MKAFQEFVNTTIPGCHVIRPWRRADERGLFIKTFHARAFHEHGLESVFREDFYSISHQGVLRGMHLQSPPHAYTKIVYCPKGRIFDAIVDLRPDSPTFGSHETFELSADNGLILYLPPGIAHGFYARTDGAIAAYRVTAEHAPEADTGVRWDTCGVAWPSDSPIVSIRDSNLPSLEEVTREVQNVFVNELNRVAS